MPAAGARQCAEAWQRAGDQINVRSPDCDTQDRQWAHGAYCVISCGIPEACGFAGPFATNKITNGNLVAALQALCRFGTI